jgi:predicted signal transduction protein with EAL and GGDEF domain
MKMALDITEALRLRALPHRANPSGVVTISVGCATLIPQLSQDQAMLIDIADKALYLAKLKGRNHISNARALGRPSDGRMIEASMVGLKPCRSVGLPRTAQLKTDK